MARRDNLSVQEERQLEKEQRRQKRKEERRNEKSSRLAQKNTARLERQIHDLTSKPSLSQQETQQLNDLKRDLEDVIRAKKRHGVEYKPKSFAKIKENRKSVYYDAELNPEGAPPPGHPYKEMNDIDEEEDEGYSTSDSVKNIPMPGVRKKHGPAQSVYESAPQVRDVQKEVKSFTPTVLARKRQRTD